MNKAVYKAVFNRRNVLTNHGTALIQIEAYLNRKRKYFGTSIYIYPKQWDKKRNLIKDHPNAIKLNRQIADKIAAFEGLELDRLNAGKSFSLDLIAAYEAGSVTNSFTKFMELEIKQSKDAPGTKINQTTTLNRLKEFKTDILFNEFDFELLTKFDRYLTKKELSLNTIHKYFRHLRKFYNMAINKDLADLNNYPFRKFKAKTTETTRHPLSPEELAKIEALQITEEKKHLCKVVDMFLFACYTGLRFSDLTALKKEYITVNDGVTQLELRMIKTTTNIIIPLSLLFNGKPLEILGRYSGNGRKFMFDELTNQYTNRCLKEVAELAGINKNITFHTARHSQATWLLSKGVSITTVQSLLGHKKLATTQIYAKTLNKAVSDELRKIFAPLD